MTSAYVLKKLAKNKGSAESIFLEPEGKSICVLFDYYSIDNIMEVIRDPVQLAATLSRLHLNYNKKYQSVTTLPTNYHTYAPPANRHTQNDGWHYSNEWLFDNAVSSFFVRRVSLPIEEVFHIYANHPSLLLQDGGIKNPVYLPMIQYFEYLDITKKDCPELLQDSRFYYKKVKKYLLRYDRFIHLFFYRKCLPNELKDTILAYLYLPYASYASYAF